MFIFKIFRIRKQVKDIKKGIADPAGFAVKQTFDVIKGYLVVLALITFFVLGFLFILGWTEIIAQSSLFARMLFWILFIPLALFWSIISTTFWRLRRLMKHARSKFQHDTIHVKVEEVKEPEQLSK